MKRFLTRKKRYTVGFQMTNSDYGYSSTLWHGAADAAEERDVNLILFPGRELKNPTANEKQYNVLYQFISQHNIDAFIMMSNLLTSFVSQDEFHRFLNSLKPLPIINIGQELKGIPSIILDNKTGMQELTEHLIEVHNFKRIAFVKGLEGNFDAIERFASYREILEKHHISFDPSLVASGDFTRAGAQKSIQELFGKKHGKIEAIMFANDEMAIASMRYLKDQGYEIPEDFAITGFDNIDEVEFETPPLSTVHQPVYEQTKKALNMVIDLIEGREVPELTIMPSSTIIRSSCGCLSETVNQLNLISRQINDNEEASGNVSGWPSYEVVIEDVKKYLNIKLDMPDSFFINIKKIYTAYQNFANGCRKKENIELCTRRFQTVLNQILFNEIQDNRDVSIWQLVIQLISVKVLKFNPDLKNTFDPEAFLHHASVMIGEMNKLSQGNLKLQNYLNYMTLRNITYGITSIHNTEELLDYFAEQLPGLGINTCIITQYEKEWRHTDSDVWEMPGKHKVLLYFDKNGKKNLRGLLSRPFSTSRLLPDGMLPQNKRITFIVTPLFIKDEHYGNSFFELAPLQGFIYESLNSQISICYKSTLLYKAREIAENNLKIALADLEKYNLQLNRLSLTDDMTGLYNRRGFMNLARNNLSLARRMGKPGIIIFADVDGLKKINDIYGHDSGDWAIMQISEILKNTFRETDIIARLGGDEFTVFMIDASIEQLGFYQKRIEKLLIDSNRNSRKPFLLSISIGSIPFYPDENTTIENLLKEADKILYNQKKKRKEGLKSES